jgi:iron(III) transport system permease protein
MTVWPRVRGWRAIEAPPLIFAGVLAVLALLVLYPVLMIVFNSVLVARPGEPHAFGLDGWRIALAEPGMQRSMANTLAVLFAHTVISMPLAVLIAWLLARTDLPGRGWLEFLYWIPYFLPSLAVTLGWIVLLDPDFGLLNDVAARWIGTPKGPFNIYSFGGIVWAHLVSTALAVKVMLLTPLFRNIDAELEETSRTCGASTLRTLGQIVLPLMLPATLVVFTLAVLHGLQAFEIELILGARFNFYVYSTQVYSLLRQEPPLFAPATALSTLMLLFSVPLLLLQRWMIGRRHATLTGRYRSQVTRLGAWRYPAFALVAALSVVLTIVPLTFLLVGTFMRLFGFFHIQDPWTLAHWSQVLQDPLFLRSLRNTVLLGSGAALVSLCLSAVVAYLSVRSRARGRAALDFLSWLPIALPGVLVGIGLLWVLLGSPIFGPLYGTIPLLVVATVITSLATGTQLMKSNIVQIGADLEDATRVAGASWWRTFRTIVLPLMRPVLLLVAVITFTHAARDISSVALLATADSRPLSLLQLDYLAAGQYESALVVASLLAMLAIAAAGVARFCGMRWDVER